MVAGVSKSTRIACTAPRLQAYFSGASSLRSARLVVGKVECVEADWRLSEPVLNCVPTTG